MKRFAFLFLLTSGLVPLAAAQETEHVQVDVFADYLRLGQTDINFAGLGGRLGFIAYRNIKLEAEMSYDFDQAFTERFTDTTGGVFTQRSSLRMLHGEFGPRVNLGERWHVYPFIALKGGFINFHNGTRGPATFGSFFSNVDNLRTNNVNGVFYPGGGFEGHVGPVGVRLDIGDELYFNHGAHNNLRMSLGPYIRF